MYRFRFRSDIPFYPKRYISHFLIIICGLVSIIGFVFPGFISYFGIHRLPLILEAIPFIIGQILFYQFLHGGIIHLIFNSFFLYQAGPEVESRMKGKEFLRFFLGGTIFVAACLYLFTSPMTLTIGISGFCMALLSYLYMELARTGHPLANQILIMLMINIGLGFIGNISLVGHASGAVWGYIWWKYFRG